MSLSPATPLVTAGGGQQYAQLLASLDGIVWEADAATFQMTFVSESAERLLGYPARRWLEPNFWADHIHPDDRTWATEFCQRATREQRLHDFEYRMVAADGRVIWLRDIVTVVVEGGEPSKLRGIMVDITEKKRAEEERQEHVRFLESLNRVNRAIQGATDLDRMMQDVLDAVLSIFDCDRAWLVYPCEPEAPAWQVPMERTKPEYPGVLPVGVQLPMEPVGGRVMRLLRAAGGPVAFGPGGEHLVPSELTATFRVRSFIATALHPNLGKPWSFGLHQCSHPRVWTPQERRLFQEIGRRMADALTSLLTHRQLRDGEARFRVLVDHATDAFFLHAADGTILDVNRQACASLGLTADELIGASPAVFDCGVTCEVADRIEARLNAGDVLAFDTRHRRKDGTEFPVEVRVRPLWEGGTRFAVSLARDTTERKKAEEALAAREAELRNLAESSPGMMGTFYARPDGTVCMPYTSPRIWDLFGLRPEDVRDDATPALARTHPADDAAVRESIAESARTMTPWRHEYRVVHPTRGELWLEGNSTPRPHPAGGVIWYGFVHDITDRKRAEEALRESEHRLDAAQRMAHVAWWERDFVTGRATRSHESYRIFGLSPAEWDDLPTWDRRWREVIHPDDLERTVEALHRAFAGGPRYDLEYRIVRSSGEERVIHSQGNVTFDPAGRPLRMFGTMQDVTELRQAERDLRASETRFRTLVDHAADAFFLMDARSTVLDVNRQACRSLGYTRKELVGKTPLDFDPAVDQALLDQMLTRLDAGEELAIETRHRHKDGAVFPVEIRVRPFWEGGKRFAVALVRDISDRKRLEEQFRQAQKMEAVGRLAGGIAHDFNNILTVINGYSEILCGRLGADDPNRELVAEIQKSGERAANLTRQLLAFSRKQVLLPQVVQLNTILGELAKLLRRLIGEDVELALQPEPALGVARVDPGQFEQAVINLAVNARDAMPDGGRIVIATRNVELAAADVVGHPDVRPGPYVLVTVTDTGHGMDEGTKHRIFEPFFTTKEPGKGTGLGLAMVYGFVKQSDGHIEVASEVGRGTTFRVFLPRAETITPTARVAAPNELTMPTGTETVLLVEDEESVRALSRIILQSCGYTVLEAEDGAEGLTVARQHPRPIHLLVTDLVMPRMSGRRLADAVREIRPAVRTLFFSGYTEEAVLTQGLGQAGAPFLQKPFSAMSLARKVREVLDAAAPDG